MGIACPLALVFLIFVPFGVLALHDVNRRPTRQFTIRGMMLFIFLWAVCLSQISVSERDRPDETVVWRQDWIVLFAWIVLAVVYWRTRHFATLLIHSTGILFFVCSSRSPLRLTAETRGVRSSGVCGSECSAAPFSA